MTCQVNGNTNGYCPQYSFNQASNEVSGFGYDAAGDLTGDGTHTYQYNAEHGATNVDNGSAVSFTYNALGLRVAAAWPTGTGNFLYDPAGTWLGATDVSAVYLGSRLIAFPDRFGETMFPHVNPLGSITMETYYNGAVGTDVLHYPWGDTWTDAGLADYQFAGTIWMDSSSSSDFATYRLYRYDLGRWLTPDPVGGNLTNPQSLNRFAYALNNPTTLTDPLGLGPMSTGQALQTCGHPGMTVPFGQNPATWCYNHMGIGGGSSPGAFFSNTADEFDLMNVPVVTQTWTPATQVGTTIDGATTWGPITPGYWATTTVGNAAQFGLGLPGSTGNGSGLVGPGLFGLGMVPGRLAPGANGQLQAIKQLTRGTPEASPNEPLWDVPDPRQVPIQALEDAANTPWARAFRAVGNLWGQILNATGRRFFFPVIVDPRLAIPSLNPPSAQGSVEF